MLDQKSVRTYRRLSLTLDDLLEALRYVDLARTRFIQGIETKSDDHDVLKGLWIAAVTLYCAPFTRNKGDADSSLAVEILDDLYTPTERALHDNIAYLRDKAFAHSDAEIRELAVEVREAGRVHVTSGVCAYQVPTKDQLETLFNMIIKLRDRVSEEQIQLGHEFGRDVQF